VQASVTSIECASPLGLGHGRNPACCSGVGCGDGGGHRNCQRVQPAHRHFRSRLFPWAAAPLLGRDVFAAPCTHAPSNASISSHAGAPPRAHP